MLQRLRGSRQRLANAAVPSRPLWAVAAAAPRRSWSSSSSSSSSSAPPSPSGATSEATPNRLESLRARLAADGAALGRLDAHLHQHGDHHHGDHKQSSASPSPLASASNNPFMGTLPALRGLRVAIETYGCQMNAADSELVASVLANAGVERVFPQTQNSAAAAHRTATHSDDGGCSIAGEEDGEAAEFGHSDSLPDVVLLNTCAIRDKAEQKVRSRLAYFRNRRRKGQSRQIIGVLGCMAERLKQKLIEEDKLVDLVVGPDAYRNLPNLLARAIELNEPVMDVALSLDETYHDILPMPLDGKRAVSSYVSIMRGCNNMCTYCIVPYTRGRERSRDPESIANEIKHLVENNGCKEVVLLGQNVNSYNAISLKEGTAATPAADDDDDDIEKAPATMAADEPDKLVDIAEGFSTVYKRPKRGYDFGDLLDMLSEKFPETRFRFTSPHPKDFPDRVLRLIASRPNLCNSLHMPAQSGSTTVLDRMGRGYSRDAYDNLVKRIDEIIGRDNVSISSDFISGFCGESEEDHHDTLSLLRSVEFDQAFMFAYSMREKTRAHRRFEDDITDEVKQRRLREVIDTFNSTLEKRAHIDVGKRHVVLVEGRGRRDDSKWSGRNDLNKRVFFEASDEDGIAEGDFVVVEALSSNKHSLQAKVVTKTTLQEGMKAAAEHNAGLR